MELNSGGDARARRYGRLLRQRGAGVGNGKTGLRLGRIARRAVATPWKAVRHGAAPLLRYGHARVFLPYLRTVLSAENGMGGILFEVLPGML